MTTPRPVPLIKALLADPSTPVTCGSTLENARNLAQKFIAEVKKKYDGTRLGRHELHGEVLEDAAGALWTLALIDQGRIRVDDLGTAKRAALPTFQRVVVAIDPATTQGENSDFTAIVVAAHGADEDLYILHAEQMKVGPAAWPKRAVDFFDEWRADRIVPERNNDG